MSKRLLAAALAAAFLATGGMARAAEYQWQPGTSTWTPADATFSGPLPNGTVTASGTTNVGIFSNAVGGNTNASNEKSILRAENNGVIRIGKNSGDSSGSPIGLTVSGIQIDDPDGVTNADSVIVVSANSSLITAGNSTINRGHIVNSGTITFGKNGSGTLEVSNNFGVTGTPFNLDQTLVNKVTGGSGLYVAGTFNYLASGKIDNTATGSMVEIKRGGTPADEYAVYEALTKVASGNIGTVNITGATGAGAALLTGGGATDISNLAGAVKSGDVHFKSGMDITFDNAPIKLGGANAHLDLNGTTFGSIQAKNIYAGTADNTPTIIMDALTTANGDDKGALYIRNGDGAQGHESIVRLGNNDVGSTEVDTTGIFGVIVGDKDASLTDARYASLQIDKDANFTNAPVVNYGSIDLDHDTNGPRLLTLGAYSGDGAIMNNATVAGVAAGVKSDINNTSLSNIVDSLLKAPNEHSNNTPAANEIGNLILDGVATGTVDLTAGGTKTIRDGVVTLTTMQQGGSFNVSKNVDVAGLGGTVGSLTARLAILTNDTEFTEDVDSSLTIDIIPGSLRPDTFNNEGVVTLAPGADFVGKAGNHITFDDQANRLVNQGNIIDLSDWETVPANNQILDFGTVTNKVIQNQNGGTIKFGQYTGLNNDAQGAIENWDSTNDIAGNIELDGRNLAVVNAIGGLVEQLNPGPGGVIDIGNIAVVKDLTADLIIDNAEVGHVRLLDKQDGAEGADVGLARLDVEGTKNKITGDLRGGEVNFLTGTDGTYGGEVEAREGDVKVHAGSTGNIFNSTITATYDAATKTGGNVIFEEAVTTGTAGVPATTGDILAEGGNVDIQKGGTFGGTITAELNADGTGGDIYARGGALIKDAVDAENDLISEGSTFDRAVSINADRDMSFTNDRIIDTPTTVGRDATIDGSSFEGVTSTFTAGENIDIVGAPSRFDGKVESTAGTIDINADAIFRSGIETAADRGTILRSGNTGTFAGMMDTDFIAQSGSAVQVQDTLNNVGLTVNREFDIQGKSTLDFLDDGTGQISMIHIDSSAPEYGLLNLSQDMTMLLDNDRDTAQDHYHQLIDGIDLDDANNLQINSRDVTVEELNQYLEDKSIDTFGYSGKFGWFSPTEDGKGIIDYDHIADTSDDQMLRALRRQGVEGDSGMISENTKQAFQDEFSHVTDADMARYEALGGGDIAKVLTGAAGDPRWYDVRNNRRAAYAAHQFANGQDLAGSLEAVQDTVRNFNKAMTNRANNLSAFFNTTQYDECGQPIEDCGGYKNRVWAGYSGQWGKNNGRDWNAGYKYDAHGFNVGYDHMTSSGFGFGAAFGYSRGEYDNYGALNDDSKIHNYDFGLFASYNHCSGVFAQVMASYTYSSFKMNNQYADARLLTPIANAGAGFGWDYAKYHGKTWSIGGKLGYDIKPVAGLTITPTVGVYNYRTHTNNFNTSAGRLGMKYKRNIFEMPVEVTAKYDIELGNETMVSLMANAGYTYNFSNKGVSQNGFVTTASDSLLGGERYMKPGHSAWNVGAGAQFRYRMIDASLNYEYYGRRSYSSHSVFANVGVSF